MDQAALEQKLVELDRSEIKREFTGPLQYILYGIGALFMGFHLYTAYFGILPGMQQRVVHLGFVLVLTFLISPATRGSRRDRIPWYDLVLVALSLAAIWYVFKEDEELTFRVGITYTQDIIFGIIMILVILEANRRLSGLALPLITLCFLAYAFLGPYLPGIFFHVGFDVPRVVTIIYLTMDGIWGVPLYVSATYIVLFVLLAAFLHKSGAGQFFTDLAYGAFGRVRGGPAKVAIVASGFFGTFSGSAVANVVGTGTFTIPLMKRVGFRPQFAGAVEAVASTGGQFMPPIMASVAFVIAEIVGVSYWEVAVAAAIPAFLYYLALFCMIDLEAAREGLKGVTGENLPSVRKNLIRNGYLLLPIVLLVYVLGVLQMTPMKAGLVTIAATLVVAMVRKEHRLNVRRFVEGLYNGATGALMVGAACANIGIIVGVLMLTGFGYKLSNMLLDLAGGNLFLLLVLTAIASLILGMGVPTLAAYLVLAIFVAPALENIGVPVLAAHLFIFYFGIISAITPPVALAAYAGAGLAGSDPWKTGWEASRLGLVAFILPFMFIYNPVMLMMGEPLEVLWATITGGVGVWSLAAALQGYVFARINWFQRLIFLAAAFLLIKPGLLTDGAGMVLLAGSLGYHWFAVRGRKRAASAAARMSGPGEA